jgi:hypothetical protein
MKIENYNCEGMCIHIFCSKKYTQFFNKNINKIPVQLCFCDEHAEEFMKNENP